MMFFMLRKGILGWLVAHERADIMKLKTVSVGTGKVVARVLILFIPNKA